MNKNKLTRNFQNLCFAIFIILIALAVFVSCENIFINSILPSRVKANSVKYESSDTEGKTYILVITGKTSRAAYKGAEGNSYVLTIKQSGQPDKESKGVVTTIGADGSLTLKPTKADSVPFGVSVNSGKMTAITGTITLDDGMTVPAPGAVAPLVSITFTSVADMAAWLKAQPANTVTTPYTVKLNVSDIGFADYDGSLGYALKVNPAKYVNIDFSNSTLSHFGGDDLRGCTSLIGVTIPNGLSGIEDFPGCTNLNAINATTVNSGYSSQDGVLYNKDKTTLVVYPMGKKGAFTIPVGVTSIRYGAFRGCTGLTSVTIPDSVTNIEEGAFSSCTSLTSITIPNGVSSIRYGFNGCTNLTSITIPASVTLVVWDEDFHGCTSLTAINVDAGNTAFSSQDGVVYNKDKTTLVKYPQGKTGAFTILDSITNIEGYALDGTAWLDNQPDGLVYAGKVVYTYKGTMPANTSITLPDGTKGIAGNAFAAQANLTGITMPDSVISIGERAFYYCDNLASVSIGNSVTSIGDLAFVGCTSLSSITIPNTVTSIGQGAFNYCTSLTSVTFQGTISADKFGTISGSYVYSPFSGDLRDKYLESGIGTYTTTAPVSNSSVWTKL